MKHMMKALSGAAMLIVAMTGVTLAAQAAKSTDPSVQAEKENFPVPISSGDRALSYGRELYEYKGRCISCHGWAGDGKGAPHSAGDAANLRKTALTRDQLIEVISCGIPGSAMPHFNAFAYSEDKCYGMLEADIGKNIPPNPPRPLQQREIGVLVDFLQARVIGKGAPSRADCIDFYGDSPVCDE